MESEEKLELTLKAVFVYSFISAQQNVFVFFW